MTVKTTSKKHPGSASRVTPGAPPDLARPGIELWGEVITWTAGGAQPYRTVVDTLKAAGLDDSVAREMLPRHAFARACKKLSQDRVINLVDETNDALVFQFTRVAFDGAAKEYQFSTEAKLTLEKGTGKVECPELPGLAGRAYELLAQEQATRTRGDISSVVQRLFERNADLFPIRDQGGAYMVPAEHTAFTEKVERFLTSMGGWLRRYPVLRGTPHGDRAVKVAVVDGLKAAVKEHMDAVAAYDASTRDGTWEARLKQVRDTRFKVEAYKDYLQEQAGELDRVLEDAAASLKAKHAAWVRAREADVTAKCDFCGAPNVVSDGQESCRCSECGEVFEIEW